MDPFLFFMFHVCLCYAVLSVSYSLVITCWEMADHLAIYCAMFFMCVLLLYNMVSRVKCVT